jgi:predicted nucleotidyltransferase component of viral defense system
MDIREICAEKIRASSERVRYRDFYDLFWIMKNYELDLREIVKIIQQKEVRKPLSQQSILINWENARLEKGGDSQRIYYTEKVDNLEMEEMLKKLDIGIIKSSQSIFDKNS